MRQAFRPCGFFALRTPLLPFADRQQPMSDLLARPEVREALFIASPSLAERIENEHADGHVERSIARYFARMCGRATPFGLFSGCSLGHLGERTRLTLTPRAQYRRHTRLDMHFLSQLIEALEKSPALRSDLSFRPNSSAFRAGDAWRSIEVNVRDGRRAHELVAAEATPELDAVLEAARPGKTIDALARTLTDGDPQLALDEARAFIEQIIDAQLLTSQLAPTITGPEPIHALIDALATLPNGRAFTDILCELRDALGALDRAPLGSSSARYHELAARAAALPVKVELSRLFQIDLVKPATAILGGQVVAEVERGIELLRAIARPTEDVLAHFREAFVQRYEQREVPLAHALDEELGIGFDSSSTTREHAPLLDGIALAHAATEPTTTWTARETFLLGKLLSAASAGAQVLELSDEDVQALSSKRSLPLPDAFSAAGTLLASSNDALDRGDFRFVLGGVVGPSGARLLGRFCHADPELEKEVRSHLRREEACRPDAIFAEVVHLPEGRFGNVICRPVLRDRELVFLGTSGANSDRQLAVSDLTIMVDGDRVRLRSRSLGAEIIPRMSTAHNYGARNVGVYRFLCALQHQACAGVLGWDWGPLFSAPFLPRVTSGKLILSRATWNITADELRDPMAIRAKKDLPRFVAVRDGDNELPIDFDDPRSVEMFCELVKKRERATLVEMFPDALCVEGPEGRFVHELVIPFLRDANADQTHTKLEGARTHSSRRTFAPGSEWLYAKIYTGTASADRILTDTIRPLVDRSRARVDRWFFIRFRDPDRHLRVRFRGDAQWLQAELHREIAPLFEHGSIWKMQLDTYEREIERYGGDEGIELAEQIFCADSDAVLALLEVIDGDADPDMRWRLALAGMNALLDDLGFELAAKLELAETARHGLATEFREDVELARSLGAKFRRESKSIAVLPPRGLEILTARSRALAPIIEASREARLTRSIAELARSYVHMHVNRIFRGEGKAQELVLYDFLIRIYESQLARARRAG